MSVKFAMLALLREGPDYGYRLRKRFDDRVGKVWRLNLGQVYQTLRTLEADSLIARIEDDEPQLDDLSPTRRKFELTDKGLRTLDTWLRQKPSGAAPMRDSLLVQLLALEPGRREEALARIDSQRQVYKRHLSRLLAHKARLARLSRLDMLADFGLEAAIGQTVAYLKWLDYCWQRLAEPESPQSTQS
jgi:DNA-binding PadR family transcriptional regulator